MSEDRHAPAGLDADLAWIAAATGARALGPGAPGGPPARVVIDSRDARPGDLFVGLPGARVDGGRFAADLLAAGAWGVLCTPEHAEPLADAAGRDGPAGAVLAHADPTAALGALGLAWRRELGATVLGITGSVGKTSTKDLVRAMLEGRRRTVATPQNLNTEIGLPLTVLAAPRGTEVLVLEMAMRGAGQIAELCRLAEPDVGLVTNVAPVHLEQLGSLEAIAEEKGALLRALPPGGTGIVPAGERLLEPSLRGDVRVVRFGPGGDVERTPDGVRLPDALPGPVRANAVAAVAAVRALGVEPAGDVRPALSVMRGQRRALAGGVTLIVDCYNANPMSMRAALDDLVEAAAGERGTLAVLGEMRELGPDARRYHAEVGAHAAAAGVERLLAVGALGRHLGTGFGGAETAWAPDAAAAATLAPGLVRDGDVVLLKASRGVGLEVVADALAAARPGDPERS